MRNDCWEIQEQKALRVSKRTERSWADCSGYEDYLAEALLDSWKLELTLKEACLVFRRREALDKAAKTFIVPETFSSDGTHSGHCSSHTPSTHSGSTSDSHSQGRKNSVDLEGTFP